MNSSEGKTRFWWGVLAAALVVMAGAYFWDVSQRREQRLLPILGRVDDFSLKNQNGQPVTRQDLLGKAWVADFIYTTCPDQCPMMSRKMQVIQGLIPKQAPVQLVSISVDPAHDAPKVLARYAEKYHYDASRWHFLTGPSKSVAALTQSFKLPTPVQRPKNMIDHSNMLVLVDARSRIRGYYDANDEEAVNKLIKDVSVLTGEAVR
jgi:protein SCO1/2